MKVIAPDLVFPSQPCLLSPIYSQFRIVISKCNENKIRLIKGSWIVEDKVNTESMAGMSCYPKLPKLNSELWESLPAHPPLQMQIADPSVAAKNMLDGSPEVQLRRKQTNDRTTRQKLQ